jgi:hypothetical protein
MAAATIRGSFACRRCLSCKTRICPCTCPEVLDDLPGGGLVTRHDEHVRAVMREGRGDTQADALVAARYGAGFPGEIKRVFH